MKHPEPELLADAATFLTSLLTDGCRPAESRIRLAELCARWPLANFALVHDEEPFDGSLTYNLMIREPQGTFSLALSPEPQLPWPLRGVLRVSENDLLRVGETRLAVSEALGALDFVWDDRDLMVRLVDSCLVQQALDAAPVALEPEQLQQAADAYRRGKGLLGAEQTTRWLADRGLTTERFATLVESAAAVAQLRKQVVADRVDEWTAGHAEELETIVVAWFAVTPEIARELDSNSASAAFGKDPCGAVGFAIRTGRPAGILRALAMNAPPDLRHADVGSALITTIEGELAVAMVLDRAQAVDDVHTRRIAERAMFDQWLAEQRDGADIEWYWGDATRTAAAR